MEQIYGIFWIQNNSYCEDFGFVWKWSTIRTIANPNITREIMPNIIAIII